MVRVWRLKTKPNGCSLDDREQLISAMLRESFLATGWHVEQTPQTPEDYANLIQKKIDEKPSRNVRRFVTELRPDDYVWITDTSGLYHLARVTGDWFYQRDKRGFDIHGINRFPCTWEKVNLNAADVSSGVRNGLLQGGTFCRIRNEAAVMHTKLLVGHDIAFDKNDILSLIGHEALEDLVGLYLQEIEDAVLVPSSCKRSTAAYEFVLRKRDGTGDVVAQVKSGRAEIPSNLNDVAARRYLYALSGRYPVDLEGATVIPDEALLEFIMQQPHLLPDTIRSWLNRQPN